MKILLVEDEQRLAAVVKEGLQAEGFEVDIVSDGSQRVCGPRPRTATTPSCSTSCCQD